MRRSDTSEMDPDIRAELEAIDATLAGEPVDPGYADLAELALLLAHTAAVPEPEFASDLDRRVARRFEPVATASTTAPRKRRRLTIWTAGPALAGVATVGVAAVLIASGGLKSSNATNSKAPFVSPPMSLLSGAGSASASGGASDLKRLQGSSSAGVATHNYTTATVSGAAAAPASPTSSSSSVKVIQSAQISLTTPNDHVNQVSQEVFNVVSAEHGNVQSSQVTAATNNNGGGYATFTLSIPTGNLQAAMTQLSRLHYAAVASRTDGTQNVSSQYSTDQRNLGDAQALRTSLLKQLQSATSETAIDSIEAQLKTASSQIARAQATLNSLNHRISYSSVTVQINSNGLPIVVTHRPKSVAHGFTIARAGHDALRVLVVSVGVALITLAVLVPVGLVLGLLLWIALAMRQRRREHALDTP